MLPQIPSYVPLSVDLLGPTTPCFQIRLTPLEVTLFLNRTSNGFQLIVFLQTHQELQPLVTKLNDGNDLTVTSLPVILYINDQRLAPEAQKLLAGEPFPTKKVKDHLHITWNAKKIS